MLRTASLTLVIGAVLLLSWVLAPASPRQDGGAETKPRPRDAPTSSLAIDDIATDVARLRGRVLSAPPFSKPARDPFRFDRRTPEVPAASDFTHVITEPPAPALPRLVAILSDAVNGTPVRRAALGIESAVRIVSVGEMVGGLRVSAISADSVELVDVATRKTFRVPLR